MPIWHKIAADADMGQGIHDDIGRDHPFFRRLEGDANVHVGDPLALKPIARSPAEPRQPFERIKTLRIVTQCYVKDSADTALRLARRVSRIVV